MLCGGQSPRTLSLDKGFQAQTWPLKQQSCLNSKKSREGWPSYSSCVLKHGSYSINDLWMKDEMCGRWRADLGKDRSWETFLVQKTRGQGPEAEQ